MYCAYSRITFPVRPFSLIAPNLVTANPRYFLGPNHWPVAKGTEELTDHRADDEYNSVRFSAKSCAIEDCPLRKIVQSPATCETVAFTQSKPLKNGIFR